MALDHIDRSKITIVDNNPNYEASLPVEEFYKEYEKIFGNREIDFNKSSFVLAGGSCANWLYDDTKKLLTHGTMACGGIFDEFSDALVYKIEKVENKYYLDVVPFKGGFTFSTNGHGPTAVDYFSGEPIDIIYKHDLTQMYYSYQNREFYVNDAIYESNKDKFYVFRYIFTENKGSNPIFTGIEVIPPKEKQANS